MSSHRFLLAGTAVALSLSIGACKVSESPQGKPAPAAAAPADFPGVTNSVPASPSPGRSRRGTAYSVYIQAPGSGDKVAFTVFEPSTLEGGKTYPLVLQASGFGLTRETPASIDNLEPYSVVSLKPLIEAGYGVISFDHRGHGESGGVVRNMDPDYEGKDVLAVLDWAEARLDWLKYRASAGDPHNLVLGSIGGSYGGMYQFLLHNIDPKHRLDAMVAWAAPNDLTTSNFPGGVAKASYLAMRARAAAGPARRSLCAQRIGRELTGQRAGRMATRISFITHSNQYFCADRRVATNGGPGTAPEHLPHRGPKVNALLFQVMRDTLFNFNEGYANYLCLNGEGGDVRLLSYQSGHNTAYVVPDPGEAWLPQGNAKDRRCGSLYLGTAIGAFFDQYLKEVPGAADAVPRKICLSIAKDDAVLVSQVMTLESGGATAVDVPATRVVAGTGLDQPVAVDLGITGRPESSVVAGIPHLRLTVHAAPGAEGEPILFAGLGQKHDAAPEVWDLIDNQVLPAARRGNDRRRPGGSGGAPARRRKAGPAPLWTPEPVHGSERRPCPRSADRTGDRQRQSLGAPADARQLRGGTVMISATHMAAQVKPSGGPSTPAEDDDPEETRDWLQSLEAVVLHGGRARAAYLLKQLETQARQLGIVPNGLPYSAYRNSIPLELQRAHPGDVSMEERITAMVRWNALATVIRANKAYGELGGHIASYASAAEIFEVGFNHFFHGEAWPHGADLVYFQPHSAPGVYARAFLEGRLSEEQLAHYRQEVSGKGLCSYPHPWLMPDFWQFPTGVDGIGPDQRHLPGPFHALPRASRSEQLRRSTRLGCLWRRRNG